MTRLCEEIVALRRGRQAYVQDLARGVAGMKATFRQAHTEMAQKDRRSRAASLSDLKATVAGLRQAFALDLQGAHRAWFGPSAAERRAQAEAARQAREAAARLRKEEERRAREAAETARREATQKEQATASGAHEAGKRPPTKGSPAGPERRGLGKKGD
jgi:hypothetical protein